MLPCLTGLYTFFIIHFLHSFPNSRLLQGFQICFISKLARFIIWFILNVTLKVPVCCLQVSQGNVPGVESASLAMDTEEGVEVVWNEVLFSDKKVFKAQEVLWTIWFYAKTMSSIGAVYTLNKQGAYILWFYLQQPYITFKKCFCKKERLTFLRVLHNHSLLAVFVGFHAWLKVLRALKTHLSLCFFRRRSKRCLRI